MKATYHDFTPWVSDYLGVRPAWFFWNAVMNKLIAAGYTQKQAENILLSPHVWEIAKQSESIIEEAAEATVERYLNSHVVKG